MKFPILYGESSTGKFKVWQIEAFEDHYEVTHGFENYKLQAKLHREKYLALIEEGFNEKEALELCKVIF